MIQSSNSFKQPLIETHDENQSIGSHAAHGSHHSHSHSHSASGGVNNNTSITSEYDYCMVFKSDPDDHSLPVFAGRYLRHLRSVGAEYLLVYGLTKEYIYVLLRCGLYTIRCFAADIEYQMLLDPVLLEKTAKQGDAERNIAPLVIADIKEESKLHPYEHIYAPYRFTVNESLYWRPEGCDHPFRELVRLKLTEMLIQSRLSIKSDDEKDLCATGDGISIRKHIKEGLVEAFYPLHTPSKRKLEIAWLPWGIPPWRAPLDDVKEYFGEQIGLYFVFMGHYTKWLIFPALLSLPLQLYILSTNTYSSYPQVAFSIVLLIWGVLMLEKWKRKEKYVSLKRGMLDFEENEIDRPEFIGELVHSYIDGKHIIYFPRKKRRQKVMISATVICTLITLIIGVYTVCMDARCKNWCYLMSSTSFVVLLLYDALFLLHSHSSCQVISIYIMRAALSKSIGSSSQLVSSVTNALQIQIFNYLYSSIAQQLTEWENHRTDTEFQDAMVVKLFLFQFVNSYSSFFYIAFIAPYVSTNSSSSDNDCGASTCMIPLAVNLAIIFGIRELTAVTTEGLIPYVEMQYKEREMRRVAHSTLGHEDLPIIEREFLLASYDVVRGCLGEYAEIAIQFGYIVLFASALPVASFIGLVSSCIETKADAFKFLKVYRRPVIRAAEDIGMWQSIFTITTIAAVVTNAAIVCFTMDVFDDHSKSFRFWFFVIFQWTIFTFQAFLMSMISDQPREISVQVLRQEHLVEKVIFRVPDEEVHEIKSAGEDVSKEYKIYDITEADDIRISGQTDKTNGPESVPNAPRVRFHSRKNVPSLKRSYSTSNSGSSTPMYSSPGKVIVQKQSDCKDVEENASPSPTILSSVAETSPVGTSRIDRNENRAAISKGEDDKDGFNFSFDDNL